MNRFLIAGRLDGRPEALEKLQRAAAERRPDAVLFAGGILGPGPASNAEKLRRWQHAFDVLGELGVLTAMIPGPSEVPFHEFLRIGKQAEVAHPTLRIVHATPVEEPHATVGGLGGELTESADRTDDRLCYARATAEYFLRSLWRSDQPQEFLLLSVAPPGQLGGDDGNAICGEFIDSYHPSVCVVAGTTERRGSQRIARTLVVSPGRLADGSAAWLDTTRHKDEQVEILSL